MIVRMWMQQNVIVVGPRESAMEAAALMARKRIRRLPVVEPTPNGRMLAGIISASDILHAFPPDIIPFAVITPETTRNQVTVGEIRSRRLATTKTETPIEEAA